MNKIRVAIIGVGNCASSLIQGVQYYRDAKETGFVPGGMLVDRTCQLNTRGNTGFLNMLERERLDSKKKSKTNAVVSQIRNRGLDIEADNVHVGPSDYGPWQKDNRVCFLRLESHHFGDVPTTLECRLSVEDSPNSAGVVSDAIRCVKLALDNRIKGSLVAPSSYFMKSPPIQYTDTEARALTDKFIRRYGKKGRGARKPKKKRSPLAMLTRHHLKID